LGVDLQLFLGAAEGPDVSSDLALFCRFGPACAELSCG